jgi:hypothetical protein
MEMKPAALVEDGGQQKSIDDAVFEVLAEKTKKNKFLVNVGILAASYRKHWCQRSRPQQILGTW